MHLTGRSGRTAIENNWYALTGRVVAVKAETDGDLHLSFKMRLAIDPEFYRTVMI
jgi:hypothetical protein